MAEDRPPVTLLEVEEQGANEGTADDHRMKANETTLEEGPCCHSVPTVVVGIADDKAGENEEEVNGQITVVQRMDGTKSEMGFT